MRNDFTIKTVESREEELINKFSVFLRYYDEHTPFTSLGQLDYHRMTIEKRFELNSIQAAVLNEEFITNLWYTLKAWGMNSRGSKLLPLSKFSTNLKKNLSELESLELYHIDDIKLKDEEKTNLIWDLINKIQVTESKNRVVSGTKMFHHLFPDLVPPMDRQYTRMFFHWRSQQFQNNPRQVFFDMYIRFIQIARRTNPTQYIGQGWRTSKTKILDNGVVAYCKMKNINID